MHPNDLSDHRAAGCADPKAELRAREERSPPDEPARRQYEPMELRELKTRVVSPTELQAGYEAPAGREGDTERREYRVIAYIVEDPAPG